MAITNIILFLSIINFIAMLFVFLNARKNKTNVSFSIFSIITTIWLFDNFLLIAGVHNIYPLSYALVILVSTSALVWVYNLVEEKLPKFMLFFIIPFSAVMFFVVSFTNFVVGPILRIEPFGLESKMGFLFSWFFLYIGGLVITALYKLVKRSLKEKDNLKKKQLMSVFIGGSVFASVSFLVNFFMPLLLGNFSYVKIVNLAFFPFLALIVYSIFRHQLFGIKVMMTQFLVVLVLSLLLLNLLLSDSLEQYIWNGIILATSGFLSYLIVKSTLREIEFDKKMLEEIRKNLDLEKRISNTFAEIADKRIKKIEDKIFGER